MPPTSTTWTGLRVLSGPHHPSPVSWADQVLYFLLVDRFSDGREDGVADVDGTISRRHDTAVRHRGRRQRRGDRGGRGPLAGRGRHLGRRHARRHPVQARLSEAARRHDAVDQSGAPPAGRTRVTTTATGRRTSSRSTRTTARREEFKDLVAAAHTQGLYVILDVVFNHTGDVFGYDADRYDDVDPVTGAAASAIRAGTAVPTRSPAGVTPPAPPSSPSRMPIERRPTRRGRLAGRTAGGRGLHRQEVGSRAGITIRSSARATSSATRTSITVPAPSMRTHPRPPSAR